MTPASPPRDPLAARAHYQERLTVAWWVWPLGLGLSSLIIAELAMAFPPLNHPVAYLVGAALSAGALLWLGRVRIQVLDGELHVGAARLPVRRISETATVTLEQRRKLLGVDADPRAFVTQRPWIGGGLLVDIADEATEPDESRPEAPGGPATPYWFVSCRHPQRLADAISAARDKTTRNAGRTET